MVTIKIKGNKDVKLTAIEFDAMVQAVYKHLRWGTGGMYGDGSTIIDKAGYARAERVIKKLGYKI